jgi:hypothetical protein
MAITSRRGLPSSKDAITCSGGILLSAILFLLRFEWLIEWLYGVRDYLLYTPARAYSAPDLARDLHHQVQLRFLIVERQRIPAHRTRETALR